MKRQFLPPSPLPIKGESGNKEKYPALDKPFSSRERGNGFEQTYHLIENGVKTNIKLLLAPAGDCPPTLAVLIARTTSPISPCLVIRLESEREGPNWKMSELTCNPAYFRTRALAAFPICISMRQTEKQCWAKATLTMAIKVMDGGLFEVGQPFRHKALLLGSNSINLGEGIVRKSLIICLLYNFWITKKISHHCRSEHLKELGVAGKFTDKNFGNSIERLGLKISRTRSWSR